MTLRDAWVAKMQQATAEEKNNALHLAIDTLSYEQVELLLDNGASHDFLAPGQPLLPWAIRRTDDLQMAHLLLDHGVAATHVGFRDLWAFFEEDKESAYKLLDRLVDAGMNVQERAKAAVQMAQQGMAADVPRRLLKPGEDLQTLLDEGRTADTDGALAAVQPDTAVLETLYAAQFATGITAEALRQKLDANGMTGLMLCVRSNHFADAAPVLAADGLRRDDVLAEDKFGQSVASLLGHRRQLATAFAPAFWHQRPAEAEETLKAIPDRYKDQLDAEKILRDAALLRVSREAKGKYTFKKFSPP
ncbi:MAG: hypothetical protein PW788_02745 [Micavibrio sp.]|nr:hypothetical protein [Micavibrio sp.]